MSVEGFRVRRELFRPQLHAFVFDLDGVIIDSEPIHMLMANNMLATYGSAIEWPDYERFIGKTDHDFYTYVKTLAPIEESIPELIADYKRDLEAFFNEAESLPIIPDIVNLVHTLHAEGWKLAVASSSSHVNIRHVLRAAGLSEYFPVQVSGEDVKHGKPAPDIYLRALSELGVEPRYAAAIEDSEAGCVSASDAGLFTLGFQHAGSGKQNLSRADLVIHAIGELLELG